MFSRAQAKRHAQELEVLSAKAKSQEKVVKKQKQVQTKSKPKDPKGKTAMRGKKKVSSSFAHQTETSFVQVESEESGDNQSENTSDTEDSSDDEATLQARAHEHILKENTWLASHTDPQDYVPGF
jgi:DNA-binding transcriptional regulator YiaG